MTGQETSKSEKAKSSGPTPMIAQYLEVKSGYPEALLFYRMGDFYEMFFHDAVQAAKALNLTLTKRGQLDGEDIAMCGVPVHAMDNYLARLIKQGFKVAICEQSEDPESFKKRGGKGPLPRAVVRLVTAGTLNEEGLLSPEQNNFLASIGRAGGEMALAWADMSTGLFQVQAVTNEGLEGQVARLQPAELIWSQHFETHELGVFCKLQDITATILPEDDFDSQRGLRAIESLSGQDGVSVSHLSRAMASAAGGLLAYLQKTQISTMPRLQALQFVQDDGIMDIDPATRRSLELTKSLSNERAGSLLASIDRTQSAAGARLLASRLSAPLTNVTAIQARLDLAQIFVEQDHICDDVAGLIKSLPDSDRCLSRITMGRGGPRDLLSLRRFFELSQQIALVLHSFIASPKAELCGVDIISHLKQNADVILKPVILLDLLTNALRDEVPLLARDGGFVKQGYDLKLDEYRQLRDESRRLIAALQSDYISTTGIASLKVKHNNVLGFHIDVRANYAETLMQDAQFIHRQTTAQTVRFTTTRLSELERDISSAADKAMALELAVFDDVVKQIMNHADEISQAARLLAELDVATATAKLASHHHYVRPELYHDTRFVIRKGRHPVVEQSLNADTPFMPNDCDMATTDRLWLLTGPNMAGKSTFLRQNALIAIIAQAGLYVPCQSAEIGIVDKCFSRVGASDDLARGQSTFMVEMVETATILNQATDKSLVILDEIGRGTATYDGLAIAHACLEYLHEKNQCRTLFATHYHELISLESHLAHLYPCTMKVKEWQEDIVFLHQVAAGSAGRSYGVHVAKLAGLPDSVVARASAILDHLEASDTKPVASDDTLSDVASVTSHHMLSDLPLFEVNTPVTKAKPHPIIETVAALNVDDLSPKEALETMYRLQELLHDHDRDGHHDG